MDSYTYSDATTFRGQLERGRGIAVRRASSVAEAGDAVYECVIADPRWDRQTDSRDTYLAGLIRELGLPLAPIEAHLAAFDDDDPDDIGLLLNVLAELAAALHAEAISVLRRYVTSGKHWSVMLNALWCAAPTETPGVWDDVISDALASRTDAELRQAVEDCDDDWMRPARDRHPRLRRFCEADEESSEQRRASAVADRRRFLQRMAETPRDELLRQIADGTGMRRFALEELGRRGDQVILDLVEDPGLRNVANWIPGASRALKHLGAVAVSRARLWRSGDPTMAALGLRVLADSGDHRDVPELMAELQFAFDDDDLWCAAEIPAEGLGRLRVAEAAPLLVAAWEQTVHSQARRCFLPALHRCSPQAAEALADEGFDDCESWVQDVARGLCAGKPTGR